MSKLKRWFCLAIVMALSTSLILPAGATQSNTDLFATLLIDAQSSDVTAQNLQVALYRRASDGSFQVDDSARYDCSINRVAGETSFFIQPNVDGVWVDVNYLTDLDGNGVYELLDGQDTPVCDSMTASGALTAWDGGNHTLTQGQTYLLAADRLADRGQAALAARSSQKGSQTLPLSPTQATASESILYLVTFHYTSSDQQEHALTYYLRLYDSVIIPSDVSAGDWYYEAVTYVLEEGLFSGTGVDAFSPSDTVTRAQLAQILWRLGGSQQGKGVNYSDVPASAWYYNAVSWCSENGLMTGTGGGFAPEDSLTREELALVLRQYAQHTGLTVSEQGALSDFQDGDTVSDWAKRGLQWAVAKGLLSGYENGTLRPGNSIERCELAAVLRTFQLTVADASSSPDADTAE